MKRNNINLTIFLCLLLAFCSGFVSCGDEEVYDPFGKPIILTLNKSDTRYSDLKTLYTLTCSKEWGYFQEVEIDGAMHYIIQYDSDGDGKKELELYPVGLPEQLPEILSNGLTFSEVDFSGEVKIKPEGMRYNPIVLTSAKVMINWNCSEAE